MKLTKLSNLLLLGATLTIAASGCKTKPQGITDLPNLPAQPPPNSDRPFQPDAPRTGGSNPGRTGLTQPPVGPGTPLPNANDVNSKPIIEPVVTVPPVLTNPPPVDLSQGTPPNSSGPHIGWVGDHDALIADTVYFEFDKSAIKASEQSKLNAVADYLRAHQEVAVLVEGNCDERGTEEYNRSLGERRALAGREYLIKLGIEPGRIDTVTYGEDRPADPGHNEAAWAKNRRDDFVVLTAPKP